MKKEIRLRMLTSLLILALVLSLLIGCGSKAEPTPTSAPTTVPTSSTAPTLTPTPTAEPTATPVPTPSSSAAPEPTVEPAYPSAEQTQSGESDVKTVPEPVVNADGSVTVYSVKQLLDAVAPGKTVELAEGVYNITRFCSAYDSDPWSDYWYFNWGFILYPLCRVLYRPYHFIFISFNLY